MKSRPCFSLQLPTWFFVQFSGFSPLQPATALSILVLTHSTLAIEIGWAPLASFSNVRSDVPHKEAFQSKAVALSDPPNPGLSHVAAFSIPDDRLQTLSLNVFHIKVSSTSNAQSVSINTRTVLSIDS